MKKRILSLILALIFALALCACDKRLELTRDTRATSAYLGTETVIAVYDDFTKRENIDKFDRVWSEAKKILAETENALSVETETSDVARFNSAEFGETVEISKLTYDALSVAREISTLSGGRYDPTVFPLVDLWGFSPRFRAYGYAPLFEYDRAFSDGALPLPSEEYISAFTALADFSRVDFYEKDDKYFLYKGIESVTVFGTKYRAMLDLGGIGKGFAVDKIRALLIENGYEYGYVSCGTSSMALLKSAAPQSVKDGSFTFNLGIRKPRETDNESAYYLKTRTKDVAVSTSGDYEYCYRLNGKIYCHIIDARTGYPMNDRGNGAQFGIASATVLMGSAARADALSTALCLMTISEAIDFINENGIKAALVVYSAGDKYEIVTNIEGVEITDDNYALSGEVSDGKLIYKGNIANE